MDGWVDGWMGGWVDGWMDGWMDGQTDGRTDRQMEWIQLDNITSIMTVSWHLLICFFPSAQCCANPFVRILLHVSTRLQPLLRYFDMFSTRQAFVGAGDGGSCRACLEGLRCMTLHCVCVLLWQNGISAPWRCSHGCENALHSWWLFGINSYQLPGQMMWTLWSLWWQSW